MTETALPGGSANYARARPAGAGREPGPSLDPTQPWEGLDHLTTASIRGLYGGQGREGVDESVWREADGVDRERALATALLRWRGEAHEKFNQRLFRKILEAVIAEQKHQPSAEKLWA